MNSPAVDNAVFRYSSPHFSEAELNRVLRSGYGVTGRVTALPSERDQNAFVVGGDSEWVLKISHTDESAAVVDMECSALKHVRTTDPRLPVPTLIDTLDGSPYLVADSEQGDHLVRLYSRVPGRPMQGLPIGPDRAFAVGDMTGAMSVALRDFFHPAANRPLPWDIRTVAAMAASMDGIPAHYCATVEAALQRSVLAVSALRGLPAQIEHADMTLTNLLTDTTDDNRLITGVIDFGDMHHTASACDIAAALTSVLRTIERPSVTTTAELASQFLDAYQQHRPVDQKEAELLGDLILARLTATVLISGNRARLHQDNLDYITQYDTASYRLLEFFLATPELSELFPRLTGTRSMSPVATGELLNRREKTFSRAVTKTFYDAPLNVQSGCGAYLFDIAGRRYLDAYNNVPVLGHSHPAVARAVGLQSRTLNTNVRYLHPNSIVLSERILATMPPSLDTCILVNSGSEAVDLAWRLATSYTGHTGALVAESAYHGVSAVSAAFSSNEWPTGATPADVATFRAPHDGDHKHLDRHDGYARVTDASDRLAELGHRPALLLADPMFTSEGIFEVRPEFLQGAADAVRVAGGLFLADEVQCGFGRTGPDLWAFRRADVVPDIVTLGKPMGNGMPIAAVVTRSGIVAQFAARQTYFNTFGGNPVSAAAANTVLDILMATALPARALETGMYLREQLRGLAKIHTPLGAVRGHGLIGGIDIREGYGRSANANAAALVEGLYRRGVLCGVTGASRSVLKVRPPLIWRTAQVDEFCAALSEAVSDLQMG